MTELRKAKRGDLPLGTGLELEGGGLRPGAEPLGGDPVEATPHGEHSSRESEVWPGQVGLVERVVARCGCA